MRNTNPEGLYSIKGSKFEALDLPVRQPISTTTYRII